MKHYRLINEYPGSVKLGTVIESSYDKKWGDCYIDKTGGTIIFQPHLVENHPGFWEEVKDEYPKIVSFKTVDIGTICKITEDGRYDTSFNQSGYSLYTLDDMLHSNACVDSGEFEIYQVAKSKDEIFTIGDKITFSGLHDYTKEGSPIISKFILEDDKLYVLIKHFDGKISVNRIQKASLFTTEDGYEVGIGDSTYSVCIKGTWETVNDRNITKATKFLKETDKGIWKYFKLQENKDKYVEENKPQFSKKQIEDALNTSRQIFTNDYSFNAKEFKQKIGI